MNPFFTNIVEGIKSTFTKDSSYTVSQDLDYTWADEKLLDHTEKYYELIPKISAISKSVNEISKTLSAIPYEIIDKKTKKAIKVIPDEIEQLLKQPSKETNYSEFISLLTQDMLIAGNSFVYIVDLEGDISLIRLNPIDISVKSLTDIRNQFIQHPQFFYQQIELIETLLIQQKLLPNPKDVFLGKGIIATNLTLTNNLLNLLNFWAAFQKNGLNPSGYFSCKNMKSHEVKKIKMEILDQYQNINNAGTPIVLPGNSEFNKVGADLSNLHIWETIQTLSKELQGAFGLPNYKQEMGLRNTGQKWNNHSLQQEDYIKDTIAPLAIKLENIFTNVLQRANKNYVFKYKLALEVYTPKTIEVMVSKGLISPNEGRRLMNLPESPDPMMNIIYCEANRAKLKDVAEGITPNATQESPKETEPKETEPKKEIEPIVAEKEKEESEQKEKKEKKEKEDDKKSYLKDGQAREKSWRDKEYLSQPESDIWQVDEIKAERNKKLINADFQKLNQKTISKKSKEVTSTVEAYLQDTYIRIFNAFQSKENTALLDDLLKVEKAEKPSKSVDIFVKNIYSVGDNKEELRKVGGKIYQSTGAATYKNTASILTITIPFLINDPGVAALVGTLQGKLALVAESTLNTITSVVQRGIQDGLNSSEIAKNLWIRFVDKNGELPKSFTKSNVSGILLEDRASTIARNEVANANRLFNVKSMEDSGVIKTIRLEGVDDSGCEICPPLQNKNYPFEKGNELSSLHCNCKCYIVPGDFIE